MCQIERDERSLRLEYGVREDEIRRFGVALMLSVPPKVGSRRDAYVDL
jgi:hypothetical protein